MNTSTRIQPVTDRSDDDVYRYHQRSKHALDGYARGPDTIDWERQPDPFRRFQGAPLVELPLTRPLGGEAVVPAQACAGLSSLDLNALTLAGQVPAQPLSLSTISLMLEYSLALSAWKQYGSSRWSLRCNPSSGNLHPTEAYLVVTGLDSLSDGVYHYRADVHGLEQRCAFAEAVNPRPQQLLLGFSSLHWREAWKYGERAYRYCQLDIGHAIAAVSYVAALSGWNSEPAYIGSQQLAGLIGVDRRQDFVVGEEEWPDCLLRIAASGQENGATDESVSDLLLAAREGHWAGRAEVIDRRHFYDWPVIAEVADRAQRPADATVESGFSATPAPALRGDYLESLLELIPHRRSAQMFDSKTEISREQLFVMLDHLLPRRYLAPWNALEMRPATHCVLFVHRVRGLSPGLYAFPRTPAGEQLMRQHMRAEFAWEPVVGAPSHLHLYCLVKAKAERTAAKLSCQQAIAADGAFSLAMVSEFAGILDGAPWHYPALYREAGAIGQALYMEAEGIGLQGTGIGCFFDDAVHQLLGIDSEALQVMYHFTVGSAVRDERIVSFAPYGERRGRG